MGLELSPWLLSLCWQTCPPVLGVIYWTWLRPFLPLGSGIPEPTPGQGKAGQLFNCLCHYRVRSPKDHTSYTVVWTSWSACIQSSFTQLLGVCALVKAVGDSMAFPALSAAGQRVPVGLPDPKPFTFFCLSLEFRAECLLPPEGTFTGTYWRIKDEQPGKAYGCSMLPCFGMLWFPGKGALSARIQLESRPLHPAPFPRTSCRNHHSLHNSKHPCFCYIFIWYGETHRGNDKLTYVVF